MQSQHKSVLFLVNIALLMLLTAAAQAATTRTVPGDFATLQAAIDAADPGDTILVAAGTYRESLLWSSKDLTLQGAGVGQSIIDPSTANGGPGGRCLVTTSLTDASHIRGFTFQGGYTAGIAKPGGGISNSNSSPMITDCAFTGNSTLFTPGAGIANTNSSHPTIANCTFTGNYSGGAEGGGIYNSGSSPMITDCTFTGNSASGLGGAGIYNNSSHPTITKCTFTGNNSVGYSGAITNISSNPTITQCAFNDNTGTRGGGIHNSNSSPTITACTFTHNTGIGPGGGTGGSGVYTVGGSMTMTNCKFTNNRGFLGGAIHLEAGSGTTITNCTFQQNLANYGAGIYSDNSALQVINCSFYENRVSFGYASIYVTTTSSAAATVTNCLLWNDRASEIFGPINVSFSDIEGLPNSTPDANGNFADHPLFIEDPDLWKWSPCINRGNNAVVTSPPFLTDGNGVLIDLDGAPRIVGGRVDVGANEFQNQSPIAHDDIVTAVKNTALTISVLANDTDPENDTLSVQSATPAGHGQVTINNDGTITYKPISNYLGADTFTYTIGDGQGGLSTATVYVNVALQTSVLVTNASCVGTGSVALYARLVQGTTAGKTNLIAGQPLLFLVDGVPVGTGITDAYGKAYVNYLPVAAGSFTLTAQFTGSGTYAPSLGTGTLTVSPSVTEITVQPTGGQAGGGTTIQGRLARTTGNKGLAGVSVTVSVDGNVVGTVTTGTDSTFACPYSIPTNATSGAHTVTASFAGNALNSPSNGSATLTVAP